MEAKKAEAGDGVAFCGSLVEGAQQSLLGLWGGGGGGRTECVLSQWHLDFLSLEAALKIIWKFLKFPLKSIFQYHLPALTIDNQNSNVHFGDM